MGSLDAPIRDLIPTVMKIFRSGKTSLTRTVTTYDETTDTETQASQTIQIVTSPPLPFELREVDEKNILRTDLQLYVPAKDLDDNGFDPRPDTNVRVIASSKGRNYEVRYAEVFDSGDQTALWRLQLR